MTLDQIQWYAQAVTEQQREALGSQLAIVQVGSRGDKASYAKLSRQLSSKNGN
jgi:hypothetical protein